MTVVGTPSNAGNSDQPQRISILIVEDEYILAINLQETLESLGYTVLDIADSAEAAIEKAAELRPNLILMDIWLRGNMDGIQAAEQIWNRLQIPVIYVTGHSDKSTVERATLTTPFGYILKPIREQELYVAIQTALNRYEREQFLSTVLRGMGDGVLVVDSQLHIKYLNPVAEVLTGWQLNEVKERIVTEVIPFLDEKTQLPIEHPVILALQQETSIYLNDSILLVTKNGTTLPVTDSATPLSDNNGAITGAVLVFRDDTQRRLLEERNLATERAQQMKIQMAELERLNRLKDDFLATTSHELRTPLSSIKLAICMLEIVLNQQGILTSEKLAQSESIHRYLTILRDQCDQELKLVNDLLDMRSLEAEVYPLELTDIQLKDWLPHAVETFRGQAKVQQQTLQVSIPPELPPLVSDMLSLTRIVSELLNNACKYTPPHGQIKVTVQTIKTEPNHTHSEFPSNISSNPQTSFVQFIISNSGVEISTEQLSRIFDPFYRIPNNNPWKYSGTGLGLALVKKLVEYLQGTIAVTSNQGWTTFTVQLPLSLLPLEVALDSQR